MYHTTLSLLSKHDPDSLMGLSEPRPEDVSEKRSAGRLLPDPRKLSSSFEAAVSDVRWKREPREADHDHDRRRGRGEEDDGKLQDARGQGGGKEEEGGAMGWDMQGPPSVSASQQQHETRHADGTSSGSVRGRRARGRDEDDQGDRFKLERVGRRRMGGGGWRDNRAGAHVTPSPDDVTTPFESSCGLHLVLMRGMLLPGGGRETTE